MSDKFQRATGRTVQEWMDLIGDARETSHREIAAAAAQGGASDWWAQSIAVEIERIIGRREIGQSGDGTVHVSVSKTVAGEWTDVFEKFVQYMEGLSLVDAPRLSATEKWRYWRATLEDGSQVAIDVSDAKGKTRVSVKHDKLPGMEQREPTRQFWRGLLGDFASHIASQ